ncbi:hypothetical protein EW146_g6600 [Bondarzewia mesenterica]|uniref:PX domain-containing protein n=1 Tax=Bondarzewia mesenterica TaxID=1095465 RepID=A0A4S4LTR0_9AGAM|nr:hypothetical protein EW146_g6600 [Bondarzewia mesenterica]
MMYDPLGSGFGDDGNVTPPWPTTPHQPNSPIPNLRRAPSPLPRTPDKASTPGLYGKQPQIYGQPEPGLISPRENVGANGVSYEKPEPYLKVRITGLDRNRRDILVKLDAQTNLSNFIGTTYRNVSRSYVEFQQFYDTIITNNPQTIVPALPLAQTSAPTDEEDDRLVRIMLQRWLSRVCDDSILLHEEELRSFIESDFGYQPTPRTKRKTSSGFGLMRRNVPDEDEELQRARFELTKMEGQFFDAAKALDKVSKTRKALATAHAEMGNKLVNVATTEAHPPIGSALRKLGRTWHSLADLDQAQAISECVILSDSLGYQGLNARSAKETLQQRTAVLEEYQSAVKSAISKRRNIERLKASSNIRPEKVDEALEDMEEANKYEQILARRAEGISQNLHRALQTHKRLVTDDITTALIEHTRSSIMYERQLLRELESLRPDVSNANANAPSKPNRVPGPTFVPPLEDFTKPRIDPATSSRIISPQLPASSGAPSVASPSPSGRSSFSNAPLSPQSPGAGSSKSPIPPQQPQRTSFVSPAHAFNPNPSSVPTRSDEPPLGGRFVDGTKSMFVKPVTTSPLVSSSAQDQRAKTTSLADPLSRPASEVSPLGDPIARPATSNGMVPRTGGLDPLGQTRPTYMSASLRVQPTRPRLDAREAASKLANMF